MEGKPEDIYAELREQNRSVYKLRKEERLPKAEADLLEAQKKFDEIKDRKDISPTVIKDAKFDIAKAKFKLENIKEYLRRVDADPEKVLIGQGIDPYLNPKERMGLQKKILSEMGFDMSIDYFPFEY